MSLGELSPPLKLRGFTSRAPVYLPLQLALHAEPSLQEQTLAKQKTSDLMVASNAANAAQLVHAGSFGFANSINSPTGNALFGVAVTFEVMDAFFGDRSDRDILKEQYRTFRDPSLHLISLKKPDPSFDAIGAHKQHFGEATKVLADLVCNVSHCKSKTRPSSRTNNCRAAKTHPAICKTVITSVATPVRRRLAVFARRLKNAGLRPTSFQKAHPQLPTTAVHWPLLP